MYLRVHSGTGHGGDGDGRRTAGPVVIGHAFLSYVREDSAQVDRLQQVLQSAGISVWRDKSDLWPGQDWQAEIRKAVTDGALVFIACFSKNSLARVRSYQNEELVLAVEQLRLRPPERPWLIPVRLDNCEIPDRDIGGGRRLSSLQRVDLFGDSFDDGAARLVAAIRQILGPATSGQSASEPQSRDEEPRTHDRAAEPEQADGVVLTGAGGEGPSPTSRVFTGSWRFTSDGFAASPLMNMVNTAMPGPSGVRDHSPFVRIGVCVACEQVSRDMGSSKMAAGFVRFLSRDRGAELASSLTHIGDGVSWTRLAGHGVMRLEAILGEADNPAGSAMLLPPVAGMHSYGRPDGVACLWLHFEPRRSDGTSAPPSSLVVWHQRLQRVTSLAAGFAEFLASDLGLATYDDPAARVGVQLNAVRSMTELVDPGALHTLPGAVLSPQFLGYAIADPSGNTASDTARTMLVQLCEYNLALDDYEPVIAAL